SALRVVELVKMLRVVTKRPVAKLFSRHIKIDTQKKMLEEGAVDVAVGTPNRVLRLLRDGDLKVNRLKLVAIDCWQDEKMRVVVDMDDTRSDLFAIWRDVLLPASKSPDYNFKLRLM
ncbi:cms1 ribosomal small subunit, partial [Coemansia sp. RSA 2440]